MASSTVEARVAATVITLKDSLSLDVLLQALDREKRMLMLAIDQARSKVAAFEAKFGVQHRTGLFGTADDMELIEWEGEQETLARLLTRLQRLEEIRVESE